MLLRLLRGAGPEALGGIPERSPDGRIVRPLLGVGRDEMLEHARAAGLSWREDASNESRRYARNRLRHDWLPGLEAGVQPAPPQGGRRSGRSGAKGRRVDRSDRRGGARARDARGWGRALDRPRAVARLAGGARAPGAAPAAAARRGRTRRVAGASHPDAALPASGPTRGASRAPGRAPARAGARRIPPRARGARRNQSRSRASRSPPGARGAAPRRAARRKRCRMRCGRDTSPSGPEALRPPAQRPAPRGVDPDRVPILARRARELRLDDRSQPLGVPSLRFAQIGHRPEEPRVETRPGGRAASPPGAGCGVAAAPVRGVLAPGEPGRARSPAPRPFRHRGGRTIRPSGERSGMPPRASGPAPRKSPGAARSPPRPSRVWAVAMASAPTGGPALAGPRSGRAGPPPGASGAGRSAVRPGAARGRRGSRRRAARASRRARPRPGPRPPRRRAARGARGRRRARAPRGPRGGARGRGRSSRRLRSTRRGRAAGARGRGESGQEHAPSLVQRTGPLARAPRSTRRHLPRPLLDRAPAPERDARPVVLVDPHVAVHPGALCPRACARGSRAPAPAPASSTQSTLVSLSDMRPPSRKPRPKASSSTCAAKQVDIIPCTTMFGKPSFAPARRPCG